MACADAAATTWMVRIVVSMLTWPASAWMVRGACPVQKVWRSSWTPPFASNPARRSTAFTTSRHHDCFTGFPLAPE